MGKCRLQVYTFSSRFPLKTARKVMEGRSSFLAIVYQSNKEMNEWWHLHQSGEQDEKHLKLDLMGSWRKVNPVHFSWKYLKFIIRKWERDLLLDKEE